MNVNEELDRLRNMVTSLARGERWVALESARIGSEEASRRSREAEHAAAESRRLEAERLSREAAELEAWTARTRELIRRTSAGQVSDPLAWAELVQVGLRAGFSHQALLFVMPVGAATLHRAIWVWMAANGQVVLQGMARQRDGVWCAAGAETRVSARSQPRTLLRPNRSARMHRLQSVHARSELAATAADGPVFAYLAEVVPRIVAGLASWLGTAPILGPNGLVDPGLAGELFPSVPSPLVGNPTTKAS